MATQGRVAVRYARAIFDVVGSTGVEATMKELARFDSVLSDHKELSEALVSGPFSTEQRDAIVSDIATKLKLSQVTTRALLTLSGNRRLGILPELVGRLNVLAMEKSGIAAIRVRGADTLTDDERTKLETKFKKVLGKEVHAEYEVDPSLIAGLHITAAGRTYDGSVAGWLNTVEGQLVGGSL